ncbi:sigma-E processing peptidase SpoIIGA [Kroppenstedtia eburnea]|uniref:Sporulation sigma-E factor-processing peptidase n=1 Tax=Kroppenstedtia eburnea TaxID=714067 RepID=A0A1N7J4M2_9BACL|nr:sigma-E processing peptidase SpoIIGA [Kroppenstedtia eburnea]EGK13198.1 sporulation sigma-E factor processing peptidase [Desmospora sp. 8437]QKI82497.1 sigma-E processing peptidase SpoIIGA [Kroppenstedtia eburnea]SIS44249.1 stage II sporulation protein GA (sporulation sigma-E factor processing peptidase) [Kroppenstedtia eburnea]
MVVYADMVFALNLCIDFLLLWLTSAIRRQQTSIRRILAAALLGASYAVIHLLQPLLLSYTFIGKMLFSVLMVWVAMGFRGPLAFLRNLGVFYLISFVTGGGMFALHYFFSGGVQASDGMLLTQSYGWGSPVSWVFVLLAFPLVWLYARVSFGTIQERHSVNQFLAPVAIWINGKKVECVGLIDTGNQLRDPISRIPVMMVELEPLAPFLPSPLVSMTQEKNWARLGTDLSEEWMTRIRFVPFRGAASDGGMLLALKPDRVEVFQEGRWHEAGRVLIGLDSKRLSTDGTYQAILHPACMPVAG